MSQPRYYLMILFALIAMTSLLSNAEIPIIIDGFLSGGKVKWYLLPTNATASLTASLTDWTAMIVNDTQNDLYIEPAETKIFRKRKHKGFETSSSEKGLVFNAAVTALSGSSTLPSSVTNWNKLQLSTPLNNGNNQPKWYKPPRALPDILVPFSDYVQIVTPSNGAFFSGSLFRPRTEISELSLWKCSCPNATRNMTFTMIVDEMPSPLATKVSQSQLFLMMQVQSRITDNGTMFVVIEVNGRWTSDRLTWVIMLSKDTVDMFGKKFTVSISVSNGKVFFSYQDESGQSIPMTQVVGVNAAMAGDCKYTVGNYLQIQENATLLPVKKSISRLYKFNLSYQKEKYSVTALKDTPKTLAPQ